MDQLLQDNPRIKQILDDTLIYDNTIKAQSYQVCRIQVLGSNHGMIFNPALVPVLREGGAVCRLHYISHVGETA